MLSKIVLRGQSEAFQIRSTYILMQMLFGGNLGFYKSGESKKRLSSSAQIRGYVLIYVATYPRGYICSQREVGDLQNMETNTHEKIITYTILNLLLYNCDLEPSEPEQRG